MLHFMLRSILRLMLRSNPKAFSSEAALVRVKKTR
jgi:hypothetical protein